MDFFFLYKEKCNDSGYVCHRPKKKKFVYLVFTIIIFLLCYIVHIEIYKSDIYHLNYLKLVDLYMFYIFSKIIVIYSYL